MVFTIAEAVGSVLSLVAEHDVLEECFGAGIPSVRNLTLLGSRDPNALVGPAGVTTAAYLSPGSVLGYGVFFENQPDATAPAARVVVSARLDANLDLNSIRLVGVVVNDQSVALPPTFLPAVGLNTVHTTIDLRPGLDLLLRIDVNLNASARVLVWQFDSLDPLTGLPTTDPLAGFLRPGAEGSVFFTITPNPGLMTDTQIRNEADIVFDQNPAMSTNDWVNTIDADAPMSRVNALPALTTSMTFSVSWTVTDIGSGPGSISVFVSDNGGPYSAFQTDTSASSATFAGEPDHIYAFYSVARDLVGNREASKSEAEAMTQVVLVKPNLQVSGLSGKAVAGAGAPYVVSNTIKNVGDALATSSATKFFLSNDATWDAGDILLEPIGGRSVPELAVGATNKTTTQVTIPAETPTAKRFLIAYVDADGAIDESSEIDNTKAKAIYIGPDIVVSKLTGPAAAASGQVISVTDTTANVGGAPTTIVTTTRFYLSRNKKLDGSDIPLGPGRSVAVLAAGTPSTASTDLTIPVGTAVGAYFILANADDGAAQVESRENNNVKALAINVN
jgi:hypothetical protein